MPDPVAGQSALNETGQPQAGAPQGGTPDPNAGGAGGGSDTGWYETLPEGLRAEKSLESFKGKPITAVVESFVNAQKSFGSRLPVPLPTDTPEARAEKVAKIREALGHPASPDKYAVTEPAYEQMGLQKNEASLKSFKDVAHKAGLTSEQVQALLDWQAQDALASAPNHAQDAQDCLKALTDGDAQNPGWGSTLPKYIAVAKRTVDSHFPPEVATALEQAGFYNNPGFIRGLYAIGRNLIEDNILVGEEVNTGGAGKSAQQELDALMSDPKGPYYDRMHPKHDETVNRALDLRRYLAR